MDVAANYRCIVDRISEAAATVGRDPRKIKLLAAAKSQPVEKIRAAMAAGVTLIGENYVQEARGKKESISGGAEWHMIGHLQRNKAKAAVELFDVVESVDSIALGRELNKEAEKSGKKIRVFIEVNLGGEQSKSGIAKHQAADIATALSELTNLSLEGLMTVPPFEERPEDVRKYFRELRELQMKLNQQANIRMRELSMGMTHDYPVAIEEGATIVRIGTALFGPRER
jgi:pyridoxal phosphate enzyme (YggS family)